SDLTAEGAGLEFLGRVLANLGRSLLDEIAKIFAALHGSVADFDGEHKRSHQFPSAAAIVSWIILAVLLMTSDHLVPSAWDSASIKVSIDQTLSVSGSESLVLVRPSLPTNKTEKLPSLG